MYRKHRKRLLDIFLSSIGLFVLAPLFLALRILVARCLGSPVLFRQKRPGRDGRIFEILKFRTMTDARGPDGRLLSDAERLSPFGRFLQSTSLDELPELWNVIRGDMSLVGPRPLLVEYLSRYSREQARHHEVRPAVTGWAQINGRNTASWEDRLKMDAWYVDKGSFWLDLKILSHTIWKTLRREGIAVPGQATMSPFQGGTTEERPEPFGRRDSKDAILRET